METSITPIDDVLPQEHIHQQEQPPEAEPQYLPPDFYQSREQPQQAYYQVVQDQNQEKKTNYGFPDFDKFTYVVIFIGFIIGFFMGKSGHPIILKHG